MSKKILIIGGQGNGTIIAHAILHSNSMGFNEWVCEGFLNDHIGEDDLIDGFKVRGKLKDATKFVEQGFYFINTILRIDGQKERISLFESLQIPEDRMATFIHPMAYVAPGVKISSGVVIMPQVSISSGTTIGKNTLILDGATVGHDDIIGDYCHLSYQACVGSYLKIGHGVHIGLNATVREHLTIENYSTLGMGAVLTKNIEEGEIWAGNPARFLRKAL